MCRQLLLQQRSQPPAPLSTNTKSQCSQRLPPTWPREPEGSVCPGSPSRVLSGRRHKCKHGEFWRRLHKRDHHCWKAIGGLSLAKDEGAVARVFSQGVRIFKLTRGKWFETYLELSPLKIRIFFFWHWDSFYKFTLFTMEAAVNIQENFITRKWVTHLRLRHSNVALHIW